MHVGAELAREELFAMPFVLHGGRRMHRAIRRGQ
jgi:hypothetical protein